MELWMDEGQTGDVGRAGTQETAVCAFDEGRWDEWEMIGAWSDEGLSKSGAFEGR